MSSSLYIAPEIVRVKRRKNDDSVDILYLEHRSKRTRTEQEFLFRRMDSVAEETPARDTDSDSTGRSKDQSAQSIESSGFVSVSKPSVADEDGPDSFTTVSLPTPRQSYYVVDHNDPLYPAGPSSAHPPPIRITKPGEETNLERRIFGKRAGNTSAPRPPPTPIQSIKDSIVQSRGVMKHFHLAHRVVEDIPTSGIVLPTSRKRKAGIEETAVFVANPSSSSLRAIGNETIPERIHKAISATVVDKADWGGAEKPKTETDRPSTPLKRPGTKALRPPPGSKTQATAGLDVTVKDTATPTLNPAFQRLLDEVEIQDSNPKIQSPGLKYRPRTPTRRLKDRIKSPGTETGWPMSPDSELSMSGSTLSEQLQLSLHLSPPAAPPIPSEQPNESDDEYVYDTYVRLPAHEMAAAVKTSNAAGLVVIDEADEDAWDQYMVHHGEEFDEDFSEDDENAENYYAADYPDDEVDSDDEHGIDPYQFRNNASDEEEFDFDRDDPANNDSDFDPARLTFPTGPANGVEDDYVHDFGDTEGLYGSINPAEPGHPFSRWFGVGRTGGSGPGSVVGGRSAGRPGSAAGSTYSRTRVGDLGSMGVGSGSGRKNVFGSTFVGGMEMSGLYGPDDDDGDDDDDDENNNDNDNAGLGGFGGSTAGGEKQVGGTGSRNTGGGISIGGLNSCRTQAQRGFDQLSRFGMTDLHSSMAIDGEGDDGNDDGDDDVSDGAHDACADMDGPSSVASAIYGAVYSRNGQMSQFSPELRTADWKGLNSRFQ